MHKNALFYLVFICFIFSCSQEEVYTTPRPRMYPKVEFPDKSYERVELEDCGFSFKKSKASEMIKKSTFFNEDIQQPCWFNITYPIWDVTIHYTYYDIGANNSFEGLVDESFKLAYEHTGMASGIEEIPLSNEGHPIGMAFDLKGPVASPYQFFITDSTEHFLRGSVYFNTRPNPDSLSPMLTYIKGDLDTLVDSFEWPK